MKLTNCFLPVLALFCLCLPGCSGSDDIIPGVEEPPVPEKEYDAVFSMAIHQNQKNETKAGALDHWKSYDYITNLNLIVFDANEQLVAFKESRVPEGDVSAFGIRETDTLHVPSGRVKVLVLANVDIAPDLRKMGTSLRDFGALRRTLDKEVIGRLSMSSDLLTFDLRAGWNFAGFGSKKGNGTISYKGEVINDALELTGQRVKLVRNVSSVFLYQLRMEPASDFKGYGDVSFRFKSIYVANVKTVSGIFDLGGDKWGSVEVPSPEAAWGTGAFGEGTGELKTNQATVWKSFFYDLVNPPADIAAYNELYFYLNGFWNAVFENNGYIDGRDTEGNLEPVILVCPKDQDVADVSRGHGGGIPVGVDFYVYENKNEEDDHTLLVICGDYTYTPVKGQPPVTLKDRYYTVVVNKDGNTEDSDDETRHTYIRKNYNYSIILTVAGPGSDKPYDKRSTAHVSAQIKVRDWDEVNMDPTVD